MRGGDLAARAHCWESQGPRRRPREARRGGDRERDHPRRGARHTRRLRIARQDRLGARLRRIRGLRRDAPGAADRPSAAPFSLRRVVRPVPPCKLGLGTASAALDEIFTPGKPPRRSRARPPGARSAPQGIVAISAAGGAAPQKPRGALPGEFESQLSRPWVESPRIPIPLLRDYDEATHRFELESAIERKQPDWTFSPKRPRLPAPQAAHGAASPFASIRRSRPGSRNGHGARGSTSTVS